VTDPASIHLHPTAPLAERVLLPGDPGRALLLAQALLDKPMMFNHNRGLWGYTGTTHDGLTITIQSTGMGGPSAAIVLAELADLGARAVVRVGTCGALADSLSLGDLVVARDAIATDGTSRALGAADVVAPAQRLLDALMDGAGDGATAGRIVSTDLFYDVPPETTDSWRDAGAIAVEMESATIFALALARGLEAASVLLVSDLVFEKRTRIGPQHLPAAERRLGEVGLMALAAQ
jgi:DeoD family purine-nucleoside phosphorylase